MRSILIMMAALVMALVFVVVFAVFSTNMQSTLRRTEMMHVQDLSKTLMATIDNETSNMQTDVLAIASWNDAREYVLTRNYRFLVNHMTGFTMIKDYGYNFLLFKDLDGRDLYTMGYNAKDDAEQVLPLGFTTKVAQIAEKALADYARGEDVRSAAHNYAGLLLYGGTTYMISTMPITDDLREKEPVGTLTLALEFTQDYVREFTGLPTLEIDLRRLHQGEKSAREQIHTVSDDKIAITEYTYDLLGEPLVLTMAYPRAIYREGSRLIQATSLMLMGLLMAVVIGIFVAMQRLFIGPTRSLASDVMGVSPDAPLDLLKYSGTTELAVLSQSIDSMVSRLEHNRRIAEKDKVSIATFQSILDSIDACLYVTDPDTCELLFANAALLKQFGLSRDIVGQPCWSVIWDGVTEECSFCPVKELRNDPAKVLNWESHNPVNGRYYRCIDKLIPWTDGKMVHFQHALDITDIKTAEEELLRLSSMIESAPQFVNCIDEKNESVYFNPAAAAITGYTMDELLNGGFEFLYAPEDVARITNEIVPSIRADGRMEFELHMRLKNGEVRLMHHYGFMLKGGSDGVCTIAVDITETRRLHKDLIEAKELAEQTTQAKTEFLSRMSHEMRTPMNAIIGMTNIAKMSQSWERREYCLSKIEGASKHLLGVINDILDMSKIEANKFELSPIDFNFDKLLENVIGVINFKTDEKHQNLVLAVSDDIPAVLNGDEQRLAQVLTNLLINACKFTDEGGKIALAARVAEVDEKTVTLRIDVSDTGIGVSKEQQEKLFKSFEQADGGISRKFGGTGLGLAISKRIVELMGGRIWIESEEGEGSTFSFTAVFGRSTANLSDADEQLRYKGLKILTVDDADDALEYVRHVLAQLGEQCDMARSGAEALEMIKNADKPYDIILVDYKMPGMDGIELTRAIKDGDGKNPVVIMMSAAEWSEISEDAISAGVSDFLAKPLFPSRVVKSINNMLAQNEGMETERTVDMKDDPLRFAGLNVLLVEDVDINREIVTSMLAYTKINFDEAFNGLEAVEMFEANPTKYDLVIMDVQMPVMDGLEASRRIRKLPGNWAKHVPILAMTANAFREDVERCIAAGMDAHVAKPLDMTQVVKELDKWLVKVEDKDAVN